MNKEIFWALIALMDGVQYHDLPGMGFSDAECDRIWKATQEAKKCYNGIGMNVTTETDLTKSWQELERKIELQNKQISLLLQSMKQEREERRQKGEQREQRLSLAVSRMELQLQKLNK